MTTQRKPRLIPCWHDGHGCQWGSSVQLPNGAWQWVILTGTVESTTDTDMLYIACTNGKRYYLPLHKVLVDE